MKKIAQGRARRRDRQLEAAERQAVSTEKRLKHAEEQLALRKSEKAHPSIDRCKASVAALSERLALDQHRLQQLKQGNYPL